MSLEAMLDMVLFEKSLPFSLVYMLDELRRNLGKLPATTRNERLNDAQKAVLEASTLVKLANVSDLAICNNEKEREELFKLFSKVSNLISFVSLTMTNMYFSHTIMQHSLVKTADTDEI
jgi:uncharacterized alpha-E superfamily protein